MSDIFPGASLNLDSFEEIIESKNIRGLTVHLSPRMKKSWNVKVTRLTSHRALTIPSYLATAPEEIKIALIEWALLPVYRSTRGKIPFRHHKSKLENQVQSYILSLDMPRLRISKLDPSTLEKNTNGCRYDLRVVFNLVNSRYFEGSLQSCVRWGSYCSLTSYQTTKTAKDGNHFHLITIAGVYNHPDIPSFAIEGVMYHEMLHIAIPPYQHNGKHVIHGPEFKKQERQFQQFNEWRQWERTHLRTLARNLRRRRKL